MKQKLKNILPFVGLIVILLMGIILYVEFGYNSSQELPKESHLSSVAPQPVQDLKSTENNF